MNHAVVNEGHIPSASPTERLVIGDDEEVWVVCRTYTNCLISSHGRAWSVSHSRLRTTCNREGWYKTLSLSTGRGAFLHRLVALAFVPGHFPSAVVNHKDGDKAHNHWLNLEWVTHKQNTVHAYATGLNPRYLPPDVIDKIRAAVQDTKRTFKDIAEEFGVTGVYVAQIADGAARGLDPMRTDHRPRRGHLSRDEVTEIIGLLKAGEMPYKDIAAKYGTSTSLIANIVAGRAWTVLTKDVVFPTRDIWEMRRKLGTDKWASPKPSE